MTVPEALCIDGPFAGETVDISAADWDQGRFEWIRLPLRPGSDDVPDYAVQAERIVYRRLRTVMFGRIVNVWLAAGQTNDADLFRILASDKAQAAAEAI